MNSLTFSSIRIRCFQCGSRRGFAPFRGFESQPYGYCHSCSFSSVPPEYSKQNDSKKSNQINSNLDKSIQQKYIDNWQVIASQVDLEKDVFCSGLINLGIPKSHLEKWNVGRGKNKKTLFFYLNRYGRFVNSKSILYKSDLHRNKKDTTKFLFSNSQGYSQCLFGEHQLTSLNLDRPIIIVESEKTAILGSYTMPDKIWIASGGTTGLTVEKAKVLKCRIVNILIDADEAGRSKGLKHTIKVLQELHILYKTIDLFKDRNDGHDLADYIIDQLSNQKKMISTFTKNQIEHWEERAAVMEYLGGLTKYEAERQALIEIKDLANE